MIRTTRARSLPGLCAIMPAARWIWRIAVSAVFLTGISGAAFSADLLVAMPNWPSGQAAANIIKYGIKEKLDLDVDVREMGTMTAFAGLDSGEVDIYPEVWLPNFDALVKKYVDEKKTVHLSPKGVCGDPGHLRHAARRRTNMASKTFRT